MTRTARRTQGGSKVLGAVFLLPLLLGLAALVFTGAWHAVTLWFARMPMLSWLPILAFVLAGLVAGALKGAAPKLHARSALLAMLAVLLVGGMETLFFKSNGMLGDFSYTSVESLPEQTQPRLLPRSGVRDDPRFQSAGEIHLARDPDTGGLVWTGEWEKATFSGPSQGVAVKRLDEMVGSAVVPAGFDHSVAGLGPGTIKWKAKLEHPFSRIQYPVVVPTGPDEAIAVMPYMAYRGFPFRRPYLKGVLVYHQDGRTEDLTPEEAARRPELGRSGRIFPEVLARKQAEAIARSDEIDGKIVDGEGNRQPFLTALDDTRTVWVTVIDATERPAGVKAVVLTDSVTGATEVWKAPEGVRLAPTQHVINDARSLPLRWEERRCCDSDGHSYDVTLREVVEPRLAFKDGHPYYMVTVVPTSELALPREIEYTLLLDAVTGERIDQFRHVEGGEAEDARLQAFFAREGERATER